MNPDTILTIPLPLVLDDESTWPQVIEAMRRGGAGRVLLYSAMLPNPGNSIRQYRHRLGDAANQDPALLGLAPDLRFYDLWSELLAERIGDFAKVGIPVGFWMGQTLGHGGGIAGSTTGARLPFQVAWSHSGAEAQGHLCPLCPRLRDYLCGALARIARAKPEAILLDDDFRLTNWTMPAMCACPLHQTEFRRRGLPDLPPAELVRRVLSGKPGPERATWWSVHLDAIVDLGRALGETVRTAVPDMRLGLCSTYPSWEESDLPRLLRALAGPTRPLVRTACAPYWLREPQGLNSQIEQIRLQRAWLSAALPEAEDLCEGDTFPHLTTRCSATLFDAYIQENLAAGAPEVVAYGFSYASPLHFETGYSAVLEQNRGRYHTIRDLVPPGSQSLGVSIPWQPGITRRLDLGSGIERLESNNPVPHWTCARLGIPVAYGAASGPVLLVGRQAELAEAEELEAWASRGLVLDAVAANILLRRGLACGITATEPVQAPNAERFLANQFNGPYAGGAVALWSNQPSVHYRCQTAPGAEVVSAFRTAADGDWGPAVLCWQDQQGRRFVVMAWDWGAGHNEFQLLWSHARRFQLQRLLGWAGRAPLPASLDAPNAHLMAHRTPARQTVISVLNGNFDPLTPVLRLSPALGRPAQVRLLGPTGDQIEPIAAAWQDDGEAQLLPLPCTLPALGICLVVL